MVVNLSKGPIGEDNAGILGAFLVSRSMIYVYRKHDARLPEARCFFATSIGRGLIFVLYYAYNMCELYFRGLVGFGGPQHKVTLRRCGASLNSNARRTRSLRKEH